MVTPSTAPAQPEVTGEQRHVDGVRPDLVSAAGLERLARALAPIRDVCDRGPRLDAARREPAARRARPAPARRPARSCARWQGKGRTTRAVIGESTDGPFTVDIRADGPHGLVAGTTGSGKSELLQTLIASLAVGNRPDEFNFVLVDYKGGAAFKDCNHLPHTVGMVTDLDGHLTTRALESLGAELRRREHQLADADAKDIEDYLGRTRSPDDEPMPRLLIVIDEFAALAAELPDFVTGLVDVARRGRSLGVHLILATQRPAGVVSAEIKSNTNLRIALRVTDAGDSDDVIESADAAEIAQGLPGPRLRPARALLAGPVPDARASGAGPAAARAAVVRHRATRLAATCRRSAAPAARTSRGRRQHPDRPRRAGRRDQRAADELGLRRRSAQAVAAGAARRCTLDDVARASAAAAAPTAVDRLAAPVRPRRPPARAAPGRRVVGPRRAAGTW